MGKIVMPKNSALLEEVEAVLKIYYDAGTWMSNEDYKRLLMAMIGDGQYASSYTKKAQITSYFGFTEWEDINNPRSLRRITESGKRFYKHLCNKNQDGILEELMKTLERVTFGRNNFGSPDSNSDVEPPVLFIRAIMDMKYITYKEYAFLLWKLEDCGGNYTDALAEVVKGRNEYSFDLNEEAQKYTDAKPIMVLIRWGFLSEDDSVAGSKRITINPIVLERYEKRLRNLKIYNIDKDVIDENVDEFIESEELSPEWFRSQAATLTTVDQEADSLYKEFQAHFAPSILKTLSGGNMLAKLFYSEHRADPNLCHTLEHDTRYQLFGGIKGGSSYKFGLFFNKERGTWVTGSPNKVRVLTEAEAIELGGGIRDELVAGAEVIANYGDIKDLNDYADLYAKVFKVMPNLINKMWVLKYLHMMFPEIFPVFYNGEWQNSVINRLGMEPHEDTFIRMGQIALFVKKCGISNVAFSKVIYKLKTDPNSDKEDMEATAQIMSYTFDTGKGGAQNRVVYGTPGCGKSFYVQNKYLAKCGVPTENRIRTTFYMDYTNTDFVGQILPKLKPNGEVTYEFNPGPFALALKMAIENPDDAVALIIEELNRGNAASIFGDIFQLLDRDTTGKSQYSITNVNLQNYLNKCFENVYTFSSISIPANLYIVATMNTSDQNVFTLDTAFKRRWQFEKIRNEFSDEHEYKDYFIPGMAGITWKMLVTAINNYIVNRPDDLASEDKQLGVYFIDKATLCETEEDITDETKIDRFAFKLFEYLWDDVAKYAHSDWFSSDIKTLDALIDNYKKLGAKVFADGVLDL